MAEKQDSIYVQMASRIELQQLQYFVAVAECCNYSKAAELLYVTQPLLSQQISNLERTLGTKLLDRSTKGVALTEAGKIMLKQSRKVLGKADEVISAVKDAAHKAHMPRKLRIGCDRLFDKDKLSNMIFHFHMQYPDIDAVVRRLPYPTIISNLQRDELDVGFAVFTVEESVPEDLEQITMFEEGLDIIISKELVGAKDLLEELRSTTQQLLILECDSRMLHIYEEIRSRIGIESKIHFFQTLEDLLVKIRTGEGMAIVPHGMQELLKDEDFAVFVCDQISPVRIAHRLYYRSDCEDPYILNWVKSLERDVNEDL